MARPLDGITVLDFSTLLPGPLATLMLAEAGARVIKVERPGGEDMRRFPPFVDGLSAPFAVLNAGKDSLGVDLKAPDAMRVLEPLIREADILVEQYRPGVMDRLGFGYAAVKALNPRLIYCSITGYGDHGIRSGEAGHDLNYQAVTGLLSLSPGTPAAPAVPAALVADIAGGSMPAVINILLALRERDRTGEGRRLDIAMADAMFTFAWFGLAQGHATGSFPGSQDTMLTGASPRYGLYATADGRFLALGALEQKFWDTFCRAIDLPAGLRDERLDPEATRAGIRARIVARSAADWAERLHPLDCCATVVATLDEALADPHFRARGLFARRVSLGGGATLPAAVLPLDPAFRRGTDEAPGVPCGPAA